MKKTLWILVLIIVLGGLVWWGNSRKEKAPTQTDKPIKVGAILPLTGPIAAAGGFSKQGIELALADLQKDGTSNIDVVFEDNQYDSKGGVSAYNKLKTIDKVDAIIAFGTPAIMPLVPLVNADKKPLLGLLASPSYSTPDDFTYRMIGSADFEAKFVSEIFVDKLAKKKIAVMYVNNDYGTGFLSSLKKYISGKATVVAEEGSASGTTDYRAQLTKIKATQPDAVLMATLYKEGGLIIKQAREMGIQVPFMCGQPCDVPDLITTAGSASEGLIVVTPTSSASQDFSDRYEKTYGAKPSYIALRTYDATKILNTVAGSCADSGYAGDCLKKEIDGLKGFPGLSYPVTFDTNGDINDQFVLKVIKGGKYVPYE